MKATVLDEFSRDLGDRSTRRGFVRLLGSVAAVGAVAVVGSHAAEAKKGKRRNKRHKRQPRETSGQTPGGQNEVCRPGAPVAQLSVPYDGTSVQTPVLAQGQAYLFQVTGAAATNGEASVDAEYGFLTADPNNIAAVVDVPVGIDVGLSIDDDTTDGSILPNWGPYNASHIYERRVIGQGRPVSLKLHDGVYVDNSGAVNVTITCA